MHDLTGTLIDGRYRLDRKVAEGGSSTVYAGEHIGLGVAVAIKILRAREGSDARAEAARNERFLDEARILERLHHPHIVGSLGAGYVGGQQVRGQQVGGQQVRGQRVNGQLPEAPYIALTWCPGTTLAALLDETRGQGPRQPHEVWQLMAPIVDAVAHAHTQGIAHCDLTPSNVMLDTSTGIVTPRLIDFGVAHAGARTAPGRPGASAWTSAYAAPEQVTGAATGAATDVHALALMFLEVLTNRRPYGEIDPELAIVDPARPGASPLGADAGPFGPVLDEALQLDPRERFTDANALAAAMRVAASAALETTTAPRAGGASHITPVTGISGRKRGALRGRARGIIWLVAMLVTTSIAVGAWWATRPPAPERGIVLTAARSKLTAAGYRMVQSGRFDHGASLAFEAPSGATVALSIVQGPACAEPDARACASRIRDRVIRDFRRSARNGFAVAYAADRISTLTVWSLEPDDARGARDVATKGLGLDVVGIVGPYDVPSGEGHAATHLSAFGPEALATQLRRGGLEVPWSGEGKGDLVAMATYQAGGGLGMAYVYKGPLDEVLKSLQTQTETLAWARSRDRLLVLRGTKGAASAAILTKVVAGTDAVVAGASP